VIDCAATAFVGEFKYARIDSDRLPDSAHNNRSGFAAFAKALCCG
jgi:hypothetical protein